MSLESEIKRTAELVKAIRTERLNLARIVRLAGKPVPKAELEG